MQMAEFVVTADANVPAGANVVKRGVVQLSNIEAYEIMIGLKTIHTISEEHRFKIIELLLKHEDGLPSREIAVGINSQVKIVTGHLNLLMKEFMIERKYGRMKNSLRITGIYYIKSTRKEYIQNVLQILKDKLEELEKIQ